MSSDSSRNNQLPNDLLLEALAVASVVVWEWDLATDLVISSSSLPHFGGVRTVEEFQSMIHPADREIYDRGIDNARAGRGAFDIEHRIILPDGEIRWHALTGRLRQAGPDAPAKLVGLSQDITDRKRAEERRHESDLRFTRFTHQLPGLAWIKDLDGSYIYANDAAGRAFGIATSELLGRRDDEIFDPETAAGFRANDLRALETENGIQTIETLTHPDGSIHHSVVSKFPIPDSDGKPSMIGGIAIDITERMKIEEALRQADRRKDEFLATLAHELRNPLAPIRNSLQILRISTHDDPEAAHVHQMLEQQVGHMVRLVDDLLEVSRITGGKIELRREQTALQTIIRSAIETSRPLIEEEGHMLDVDIPDEPMPVDADPVRLAQVIANVLNNAAKYTERGGTIDLSAKPEGDDLVIRIRDTGVGIPEEMLPRVFDMFAQVDRSMKRAQGGLGIGLALARSLVEMHDGTIEAHSDGPGRGSEFTIRLQRADAAEQPPDDPAVVVEAAVPTVRKRILVVDDHKDGADSLAMLLKLLGGEAEVAYSGPAAIEAVRRFAPMIVLLDIGMPGMDGYEVARLLRQEHALDDLVLIALTGWGQEEDRLRTSEAGFNEHWVKPVDATRLRTLIAREG